MGDSARLRLRQIGRLVAGGPSPSHMSAMPKSHGARAAPSLSPGQDDPERTAEIIAVDEVAQRRARLLAYVDATRPVIVYRFAIPPGASAPALGTGVARNARAQLDAIVGMTGGAVAKSAAGLALRIPETLAAKFEALAGPLIGAYLVSLELDAPSPRGTCPGPGSRTKAAGPALDLHTRLETDHDHRQGPENR